MLPRCVCYWPLTNLDHCSDIRTFDSDWTVNFLKLTLKQQFGTLNFEREFVLTESYLIIV